MHSVAYSKNHFMGETWKNAKHNKTRTVCLCWHFWSHSVGSNRKYSRVRDDIVFEQFSASSVCQSSSMSNQDTTNICFERSQKHGYLKSPPFLMSINTVWVPLRSFLCSAFLTFHSILYYRGINHFTGSKPALSVWCMGVIPLAAVSSGFCSVINTHIYGCLALSSLLGSLVLLPHASPRGMKPSFSGSQIIPLMSAVSALPGSKASPQSYRGCSE